MLEIKNDKSLGELLNNAAVENKYFSEDVQLKGEKGLREITDVKDLIYINYLLCINAAKPVEGATLESRAAQTANLFSTGYRAQIEIASSIAPELGEEMVHYHDQVVNSNAEALLQLSPVLGIISTEIQMYRIFTGIAEKDLLFKQAMFFQNIELELEQLLEHTSIDYQVEKGIDLKKRLEYMKEQFKDAGNDIAAFEEVVKMEEILKEAIDSESQLEEPEDFLTYYQLLRKTNFFKIKDTNTFKYINDFGAIMSERNFPKSIALSKEIIKEIIKVLNVKYASEEEIANPVVILQNESLLEGINSKGPHFLNLIFLISEVVGSSAFLENERGISGEIFEQIRYDYLSAIILTMLFFLSDEEIKKTI